jgi:hypothetical protein
MKSTLLVLTILFALPAFSASVERIYLCKSVATERVPGLKDILFKNVFDDCLASKATDDVIKACADAATSPDGTIFENVFRQCVQ